MRKRRVLLVVGALVVVLLAGIAVLGVRWFQDRGRPDLQRALELAPAAERYSFTAWAEVRRALPAKNPAKDPSGRAGELAGLLDRGFDRDLTSASALVESAELLDEAYGWSPLSATWELFAQSTEGAVTLVRLPEDTSFDDLRDRLESLGYTPPAADDGVWLGGEELVARIAAEVGSTGSPVLQYVALDEDERLVRTADSAAYLRSVVAGEVGDAPGDLDAVVEAVGDPLSAAVYTGDHTCSELAMAQADDRDRETAEQLVADAGETDPVLSFAMAAQPDGEVRVAMAFEDAEDARTNADTRAVLAAGAAPGQGGDFADRFELGEVTADGTVVTMALDPVPGSFVLSDLSTGPVLFATC
ncbi:hypothetical protein [Nocardioides pantholopis]|uniref:hypothetical protein n=1 Tax=Nocardioides pantholopis TaxID=2483798 RepID=UPI000FD9663A|nr:hypothetical protein [Nocardioides pantholopis]